jgi:hypothetical protein
MPRPYIANTSSTTTVTGRTALSARPLPCDHSPTTQQPRSTTSGAATDSADCSTGLDRDGHHVVSCVIGQGVNDGIDAVMRGGVAVAGEQAQEFLGAEIDVTAPVLDHGSRSGPRAEGVREGFRAREGQASAEPTHRAG